MSKNIQNEYTCIRERIYDMEEKFLSPFASKAKDTKGIAQAEEPCSMRTDYQRDRDRIIYSNSFKRLKNKTQVFVAPEGDHYITRLTHTLDVSQIARSIARVLCLNEDLTEAIALGHDLGHTPFGHVGENVLDKLSPFGFEHNVQSLRVVDTIERGGKGLNLTWEVRNGIINHKKSGKPATLEGVAVSWADRIAYINHDIEDAIRAGILKEDDLPQDAVRVLGKRTKERIHTAIESIYKNSFGKNQVAMSDEVLNATNVLREFMFERVYWPTNVVIQERAERMLTQMYEYFIRNVDKLPKPYFKLLDNAEKERVVCDYISGMTDRYAVSVFESLFIPANFAIGGVENE